MNERMTRISRYYGNLNPKHLLFNANLQDFVRRVELISSLQTGGKISPQEAIERIDLIWQEVKSYEEESGINLSSNKIAELLMDINPEQRPMVFGSLQMEKAMEVFSYLRSEDQAGLISALDPETVINLIRNLEIDDRVSLLDELPEKQAIEIINHLSPEERKSIDVLLSHAEGTVGRMMNPNYLAINGSIKVQEALEAVRRSPLNANELAIIFIVDEQGFYRGFFRTVRLLRCDHHEPVNILLEEDNIAVATADRAERAVKLLEDNDLPLIPVVDGNGKLVGSINFEDAIELVQEEATDTALAQAGVGNLLSRDKVWSEKLVRGSIWYAIKLRITFLIVTLIGGMIVGGVIENFEGVLAAIPAVAIFIPLVMDMGGNVGTQSTTIFARGLAWDQLNLNNFFAYLFRESRIGITMGLILGAIAGIIAYFWQGVPNDIPQLALVVIVALVAAITLGATLGALLPWMMLKLGFDHGPGADPFITTIQDFVGLWIYFSMATWLIQI